MRKFLNNTIFRRFGYELVRLRRKPSNGAPSQFSPANCAPVELVPPSEATTDSVEPALDAEPDRFRVRRIATLEQLDEILLECDRAQKISDDALRRVFKTFEMQAEALDLPDHPESREYRELQFALYRRISGREYSVANEASNWLSVDEAIKRPFPYYTDSYQTVSDQLIAIGLIVKTMRLPPRSRILEFGPGWGNTTVTLARMGYRVTAVDIESRFLDVIRGRAVGFADNIETIVGDFSIIDSLHGQYDAILFYESFHHCSAHQSLIAGFDRRLAADGIVVFASEPITDAFPMPWGLRLDGQSLWAARKFGWLELGFQERYFRSLLAQQGWKVEKHAYDVTPLGVIFIGRRA